MKTYLILIKKINNFNRLYIISESASEFIFITYFYFYSELLRKDSFS